MFLFVIWFLALRSRETQCQAWQETQRGLVLVLVQVQVQVLVQVLVIVLEQVLVPVLLTTNIVSIEIESTHR